MQEINYLGVIVAAIVAVAFTGIWYIAFSKVMAKITSTPFAEIQKERKPWKVFVTLGEYIIIALILAYFVERMSVASWTEAAMLGFVVWVGFSATQWFGAMTWDKMPWGAALIRAGD